ncbi:hypothetical protein ABBQ38_014224 [Trebouxia sp. C0009 RCD-2024]
MDTLSLYSHSICFSLESSESTLVCRWHLCLILFDLSFCWHAPSIPDASDVTLSRYSRHTGDKNIKSLSSRISFQLKQYLATTAGAQASLLCLVLLMTSMVLGDGVLTPAQSVLGAFYGLQVKTSVSQGAIVGISCGIAILLFMVQRFGTGRIGFLFAPIVLIYFLCNLIIAITNISCYKPDIFKVKFPVCC